MRKPVEAGGMRPTRETMGTTFGVILILITAAILTLAFVDSYPKACEIFSGREGRCNIACQSAGNDRGYREGGKCWCVPKIVELEGSGK